jgi:hypothetical protein
MRPLLRPLGLLQREWIGGKGTSMWKTSYSDGVVAFKTYISNNDSHSSRGCGFVDNPGYR